MAESAKGNDLDADEFAAADSGGEQTIDLEPGESVMGHITRADLTAGDNGVIEIDGNTLWLNGRMANQLVARLVEGQPVMHEKEDEQQSFTDDSGEEIVYHNRNLRFLEGDD